MKKARSQLKKEARNALFEKRRGELAEQGYQEQKATISVLKANVFMFLTAGPFALLFLILFSLRNGFSASAIDMKGFLIFLAAFAVSIPIHEGIHGFAWHFFCKDGWKSIGFGMMWEYLTPYCHCKEPLRFGGYMAGVLAPFFVLGVIPCVIAIFAGNGFLLAFGAIGILTAGGDTTIACMALKYRHALLIDHPSECGFYAYQK